MKSVEEAREILTAVRHNMQAVRSAASEVFGLTVLPKPPRRDKAIQAINFSQGTVKAAAAVSQRLGLSDEETLRYICEIGAKGRVLLYPGIQMPYQAVGYYLYKELQIEDETRQKLRTIVEVGAFSNGGVPEALAADMVKNLCVNDESDTVLGSYRTSTVCFEKNEE